MGRLNWRSPVDRGAGVSSDSHHRSRRGGIAIVSAAIAMQVCYAIFVYEAWGGTFLTIDSVWHLYISRLILVRPVNMGGIWLPLFNMLEAPFTLVPFLYTSGFAGVIVNSIATGLTSLVIYRMLPNRYGTIISLAFAGNILTLSFSTTAMQEPTAVFLAMASLYYLREYLATDKRSSFFKMAVALSVGELARYELWLLATLFVLVFVVREVRRKRTYNLAFAHLGFWGVFLWILFETAIFRKPFFFLGSGPGHLGAVPLFYYPRLASLDLILSRVNILYELMVVGMGIFLVAFWKRPRLLAGLILILLVITVPFQAFFVLNGSFPPSIEQQYGYSTLQSGMELWDHVGDVAQGTILVSNLGPVGGAYLSVLGGVDFSHIIDEYSPSFAKVSRSPWRYVDSVIITKSSAQLAPKFQSNEVHWKGYFNYLFYKDPDWRNQFEQYFAPAYSTPAFVLYLRESPSLTVPGPLSVVAGSTIGFTVNATNTGTHKTIELSATGLPPGASFPSAQGTTGNVSSVFSWTPSYNQVTGDYDLAFTADDGEGVTTTSHVMIHASASAGESASASTPTVSYPMFSLLVVLGLGATLGVDVLWKKLMIHRRCLGR